MAKHDKASIDATCGDILDDLISEYLWELSIDAHWGLRMGYITQKDLWKTKPSHSQQHAQSKLHGKDNSGIPIKASSLVTICPICHESIGAIRFAPHLERCMRGGKRGATRRERNNDDLWPSMLPYSKPKPPPAVVEDPYPKSLVVRIKLTNSGVPSRNQKRFGASMAEFLEWQNAANARANAIADDGASRKLAFTSSS